jgi:hypothetical protein
MPEEFEWIGCRLRKVPLSLATEASVRSMQTSRSRVSIDDAMQHRCETINDNEIDISGGQRL